MNEKEARKRLNEFLDSDDPCDRWLAGQMRPRSDPKKCKHATAVRGPGSAYCDVACSECGISLGRADPPEMSILIGGDGKPIVDTHAAAQYAVWKAYEALGSKIQSDWRDQNPHDRPTKS